MSNLSKAKTKITNLTLKYVSYFLSWMLLLIMSCQFDTDGDAKGVAGIKGVPREELPVLSSVSSKFEDRFRDVGLSLG